MASLIKLLILLKKISTSPQRLKKVAFLQKIIRVSVATFFNNDVCMDLLRG